jgi:hypothetical protein
VPLVLGLAPCASLKPCCILYASYLGCAPWKDDWTRPVVLKNCTCFPVLLLIIFQIVNSSSRSLYKYTPYIYICIIYVPLVKYLRAQLVQLQGSVRNLISIHTTYVYIWRKGGIYGIVINQNDLEKPQTSSLLLGFFPISMMPKKKKKQFEHVWKSIELRVCKQGKRVCKINTIDYWSICASQCARSFMNMHTEHDGRECSTTYTAISS